VVQEQNPLQVVKFDLGSAAFLEFLRPFWCQGSDSQKKVLKPENLSPDTTVGLGVTPFY
jgi:hypothetical protein